MIIETERVILRNFSINDAEKYFELTRDKDVQLYVPYTCSRDLSGTIYTIGRYYSNCDFINDFYFIIELKKSHDIIGTLIVNRPRFAKREHEFEVSYFIDSKYREHGYASEALTAFISSIPKGSVLIFEIDSTNFSSLRLISKFTTDAKLIRKTQKIFFRFEYVK